MATNTKIFTTTIGNREVSVEIGTYCEQANGSCLIRCGETVVLTNVTMAKEPRAGIDFFPLGCDFEEKMYAVGKIPGGFKKREGRPSDKAILTSRLIDRPLRPLFPKGMYNDVAVTATALSVDKEIPPEVFAMVGSSIALSISDIPWAGPTGSVVVAMIGDEYIINPTPAQKEESKLVVNLAGTKDAIMMVEAGAQIVSEKEMLGAILFGHEEIKKIVAWIEGITAEVGKPKKVITIPHATPEEESEVRAWADAKMDYVLDTFDRKVREERDDALNAEAAEYFADKIDLKYVADIIYAMKKEKVRAKIINNEVRPDGRKLTDIRPIWCNTHILPRVHGSAVFTRGQTQALTTCTLGTISEVQKLEGLDDDNYRRYMHHYNMPPYSTGEAKPLKSPGRREIGHGALAERSLEPVLPSEAEFPYAIRTVSEILSSNGSTSQASVCGSTMALMDAGVPIKAPVAGIAMGLIKDDATGIVKVMSDIQGLEDFLGDMDFKVAGTAEGITAIQMDIKIKGISEQILTTALEQARQGRLYILGKMAEAIAEPRKELSKYAPKIISFNIDPEKIGDVIGKSGKVINAIVAATDAKIDISDDGNVFIACEDTEKAEAAKKMVLAIAKDPEIGDVFEGPIVRILQFGAFVNIAPGKDGLIHISKLAKERVEKVEDVVNIGDVVRAEVIKVSDKGIDLKLKKIISKANA